MPNINDIIKGSFYAAAIGDGFGYPNEFLSYEKIKSKWGVKGLEKPCPGIIKVTDDTQLSLAVSRAIQKSYDGNFISKDKFETNLIFEFLNWYSDIENDRDPGFTCLNVCEKLSKGINWLEATSIKSKGCGSNMRVSPLSFIYLLSNDISQELIAKLSQFQAAVTHSHPTALVASDLTSYSIYKISKGLRPSSLLNELFSYVEINMLNYHEDWLGDLWKKSDSKNGKEFISLGWEENRKMLIKLEKSLNRYKKGEDPCKYMGDGWVAEEALGVSLLSFLIDPSDTVEALKRSINTNGDSDTIGCITGSLVGAYNGLQSIPKDWIDRLEYKDIIRNYCDFLIGTT